jgi:acetolactate synthase-1/2/3 large subunit
MIRTLAACGVDTCFANPGTSEMHFVAALDAVPEVRGVLGLFEGVVTGAADGYGRMAGRPAATLLHLGPGLGNGLANLHNARRAATPVVNVVGDHASYHLSYDAPLQSDIDSAARVVSGWIGRPDRPEELATVTAEAVAAALGPPGQVATLVLPADVSWGEGAAPAPPRTPRQRAVVGHDVVDSVAKALRSGQSAALVLGGSAMRLPGLYAAGRVCAGTGARLLAETFSARVERGAGIPAAERLAYFGEFAQQQLAGVRHLVLVDARPPVTFFAYPGKPSDLVPPGCEVHVLAGGGDDVAGALEHLAELVGAARAAVPEAWRPERPTGTLTTETLAAAVGAVLPDGAIVSDESGTMGIHVPAATARCPRHDWLMLTGGSIGQGLPVALGAAVACPDRPVVSLQADGSAMYTIQTLWTQAREGLDVTTVLCNNRSYGILNIELERTGAGTGGPKARAMLDLSRPELDFVRLAEGMGMPATTVTTADEAVVALERAIAEPGPHLVEAILAPSPAASSIRP